jgi:TM2 domain-containing membrane protein YozV
MFCQNCGAEILPNAIVCVKCGVASNQQPAAKRQGHSFVVTLVLCLCLGGFGAHRFYTGNTGIAIGQMLTCGGLGIWTLVDFIQIVSGSYRDGDGLPLSHDE